MRPVGVHLDDELGAAGEGDAEAVEVGPAEALLGRPMADADRGGRRRPARRRSSPVPSGEPSSTTSSVAPGRLVEDRRRDRPDVLGLVVRRQDDPGAGALTAALGGLGAGGAAAARASLGSSCPPSVARLRRREPARSSPAASPEVARHVEDHVRVSAPRRALEDGADGRRPSRCAGSGRWPGFALGHVDRRRRAGGRSARPDAHVAGAVGRTTVRLAVTATASTGMVPRPVGWKSRPRCVAERRRPGRCRCACRGAGRVIGYHSPRRRRT